MKEEALNKALNIVKNLIIIKRYTLMEKNEENDKLIRMHVRNAWEELKDLLAIILLPCFDESILVKYIDIVSLMESKTKQTLLEEIEFVEKEKRKTRRKIDESTG